MYGLRWMLPTAHALTLLLLQLLLLVGERRSGGLAAEWSGAGTTFPTASGRRRRGRSPVLPVLDALSFEGQDGGQRVAAAVAALGSAGGTVTLGAAGPDDVTSMPEGRLADPVRGRRAWGFTHCVVLPSHVTVELNGAYLFQKAVVGPGGPGKAPAAPAQGFFISERWGGPAPANASSLAFYVQDVLGSYTWPLYMYDVPGAGRSRTVYFPRADERSNDLPPNAQLFLPLDGGHLRSQVAPPPGLPSFAQRFNVDIAIVGREGARLESNADWWYEHGVCVHKPCRFGPGADPAKDPLLSSDVGNQVLRMGNVVGLTIANITLSRTGGWATFFRDTARVTVSGFRIVQGYRDGYHIYGMAINHSVTDYVSQLRDNNVALLGDRVHARNVVFRRLSMRNSRVDPIRLNVHHSDRWSSSNIISNLSFFQVDNYENGKSAPFVMLGHVQADMGPAARLVDISFVNTRIHNNDTRYQCQDAFRLVQPVKNLRLTDVSILSASSQAMRDVSHHIIDNFTTPVKLVDGLRIVRMRMHPQSNAIQLGHSLPPSFANNTYGGVSVDGKHVPCTNGCSCDFDAGRHAHCDTWHPDEAHSCQHTMSALCDNAKRASTGNCFVCAGQHASALHQAQCTEHDLDQFCSHH